MTARLPDLEWVDERLKAWARYFKDRHKYSTCGSGERGFNSFSKDSWDEGWGSKDEIPPPPIAPLLDLRSVLQTHSAIHALVKSQRWALTYGYCYPGLPRWQVLNLMRKYTGRRFTWRGYLDELDMGRVRVAAYLLEPRCVAL